MIRSVSLAHRRHTLFVLLARALPVRLVGAGEDTLVSGSVEVARVFHEIAKKSTDPGSAFRCDVIHTLTRFACPHLYEVNQVSTNFSQRAVYTARRIQPYHDNAVYVC